MRTYILIHFWLMFAVFIMHCIDLTLREYPRKRDPETIGTKAAQMFLILAWMVFAGLLLWGRKLIYE